MKLEMKINGRRVTSAREIERELKKAAEKAVENSIRQAAGPGVRLTKTSDGYVAEGTPDQINRLTRRLR